MRSLSDAAVLTAFVALSILGFSWLIWPVLVQAGADLLVPFAALDSLPRP